MKADFLVIGVDVSVISVVLSFLIFFFICSDELLSPEQRSDEDGKAGRSQNSKGERRCG